MADKAQQEVPTTIADSNVMSKYKDAATIANGILRIQIYVFFYVNRGASNWQIYFILY